MKAIHVRFPDEELHKAIEKSAKRNRRSLNSEVLLAIEYFLDNAPEAKPAQKEIKKKT